MDNKRGLGRFLTQLKTDDWLGKLIDSFQDKEAPERWVDPNIDIHPSSAGSPCARDIQLGFLGYRTEIKAKNKRRMDNGTYGHMRWEKYLNELGILHSCEVNVRSINPNFNGTCDIIVQNPTTGKLHIGEIKTMNSNRWKRIPEQQEDKTLMMRHLMTVERPYVYQLTMYMVMIPKVLKLDISNEGFFLFENTDTQEFKIRYGIADDRLRQEVFENPIKAQESTKKGKLLDMPYRRGSPTCESCYKKKICYLADDGDEDTLENIKKALNHETLQHLSRN